MFAEGGGKSIRINWCILHVHGHMRTQAHEQTYDTYILAHKHTCNHTCKQRHIRTYTHAQGMGGVNSWRTGKGCVCVGGHTGSHFTQNHGRPHYQNKLPASQTAKSSGVDHRCVKWNDTSYIEHSKLHEL